MEKINDNVAATMTSAAGNLVDLTNKSGLSVSSKADQLTGKIGQQIRTMAEILRERSPHETIRKTTYKVADKLESAGSYLEGDNLKILVSDAGSLVRRYPIKLILIGVGVGFLLARGRGR